MTFYRKCLVFMLRLGGTATGAAFLTVFLPEATMASIHESLGLGPFPAAPVTDYLSRTIACLYGYHGIFLWILSMDLKRYAPLIRFAGFMNLSFGIVITVVDFRAGLPAWWSWGEGPAVIMTGVTLLLLLSKSGLEDPSES